MKSTTLQKLRNSRSGFTLIEILVVMAIIGILLAIAVPAIVGQVQRQRENASAGNAANLALACFNYNTDNGAYPYGATSTAAWITLFPSYLQDPANLFLTKAGGHSAFTGAAVAALAANNVCFTITMNGTAGLTGSDPTNLPLLLSDLGGGYPTFPNAVSTTVNLTAANIWGPDGITVAKLDQSTAFIRPTGGMVTLTPATFAAVTGANYTVQAP